jgi:hypothetical protein
MRRVYGRVDRMRRTFCMDIWRTYNNRLLVRFWSRSGDVDGECWEIIGGPDVQQMPRLTFDEGSAPNCLREAYDNWMISNL